MRTYQVVQYDKHVLLVVSLPEREILSRSLSGQPVPVCGTTRRVILYWQSSACHP